MGSALAPFAVLVAGLASAPPAQLALQLAVQRSQQLAAQQSARSPLACDVFFFLSSVASGWTTGAERLSNPPCRTGALEHPVRARVRGESVCFVESPCAGV